MISFSKESLVEMGRAHWKEFQPTKYRELKASGQLEAALNAAANLTLQAMEDDRAAGYSQYEAWEANREHHLILPEEYDPEEEPMPDDPLYDAIAEKNRAFDEAEDD